MSAAGILAILSYVASAMAAGAQVATLVRQTRDALNVMLDENRDPTPEELNTLFGRLEERSQRIQDA